MHEFRIPTTAKQRAYEIRRIGLETRHNSQVRFRIYIDQSARCSINAISILSVPDGNIPSDSEFIELIQTL